MRFSFVYELSAVLRPKTLVSPNREQIHRPVIWYDQKHYLLLLLVVFLLWQSLYHLKINIFKLVFCADSRRGRGDIILVYQKQTKLSRISLLSRFKQ